MVRKCSMRFWEKKEEQRSCTMQRMRKICVAGLFLVVLGFGGCAEIADENGKAGSSVSEDERFEAYTREVFCSEVSANAVSLHYTLKYPQEYGIESAPAVYGTVVTDEQAVKAGVENMEKALITFEKNKLSVENQITYDVLQSYLDSAERSAEYLWYDEPLGTVSGVQTQLPVVLSEYRFYEKEDADTYLDLMRSTGNYFDEVIAFERGKSEKGLFMSEKLADAVIEQCQAFLDMGNGNYLYSTFVERMRESGKFTEEEMGEYTKKNAQVIEEVVCPAYERLMAAVRELKGTGKNEEGLCGLPQGQEYYQVLVDQSVGTKESIVQLEELTRRQMEDDITAMEGVLGAKVEEAKESAADMKQGTAELILKKLSDGIEKAFPETPDTTLEVKYVPKEMEEHLSPAFYMIPAIDNSRENVIYINQGQMRDDLSLFTTLAHEGYPGHLYQTVYYSATKHPPIRDLLSFGGYTEGWATYCEMLSYYYSPLSHDMATLLQHNASVILGLYALADMGIHYDGWTLAETVAFFRTYGITNEKTIEDIFDLIVADPGNYLKYYIGYVEFLELKKLAIKTWGDDFTQNQFHQCILDTGPAPFEILQKQIKNAY